MYYEKRNLLSLLLPHMVGGQCLLKREEGLMLSLNTIGVIALVSFRDIVSRLQNSEAL